MLDREGGDAELENTIRAMQVFGEAKVPIARQRFTGDTFNHLMTRYDSVHRGGYRSHAMIWRLTRDLPDPPSREELDRWWTRFCLVYEHLVPLAEESGVKLALHPSDVPLPETPFGTIGFHRVIDTFPSRSVGYLYCCGTRAEAGGLPLVLDEINNYGRKGRIFMIHFRNIRGSFSTSHGYEETLLDDGDMNMFKILLELKRVGFDGYLNADHIPAIEGDAGGGHHGLAYSIGYIKAMLAALAAI
ncbi:MAG: mannonate dehydratase, partial [candidate division Zixibacteria bacterium]|nr:mannonate dehydratase [candidate division Zixibacteria bacterium]